MTAHVFGWCVVAFIAAALYAARRADPDRQRRRRELRRLPAVDTRPVVRPISFQRDPSPAPRPRKARAS